MLPDDTVEEPRIRMNKTVRKNLRVRLGDVVSVHQARLHLACAALMHWLLTGRELLLVPGIGAVTCSLQQSLC